RGSGRTRSRPWWPPGTRTRRRPPRLPVPREPATAARRSWAERLGPGPDGIGRPRQRMCAALLEVSRRGLPERLRAGVGDAALDRPAEAGNEAERLARDRAEAQTGADHCEDLRDALAVDLFSVRRSDAEDHSQLVQREHREVGARNEDGNAENSVLACEAAHDRLDDGLADDG